MEPLRPVDRQPVGRGVRLTVPDERSVLLPRNRVRADEHDGEQDLRVFEGVKRRVANRLAGEGRRISRGAVQENLPARGPDHLEPTGSNDRSGEAERADEIMGVGLVDLAVRERRRMEREVADEEPSCVSRGIRREVQPKSHLAAEVGRQTHVRGGPDPGSSCRQRRTGTEREVRPVRERGRVSDLEAKPILWVRDLARVVERGPCLRCVAEVERDVDRRGAREEVIGRGPCCGDRVVRVRPGRVVPWPEDRARRWNPTLESAAFSRRSNRSSCMYWTIVPRPEASRTFSSWSVYRRPSSGWRVPSPFAAPAVPANGKPRGI